MTAGSKGSESLLQLKMPLLDGGKQRPNPVLQLRTSLGEGGKQRPRVRATAEAAVV